MKLIGLILYILILLAIKHLLGFENMCVFVFAIILNKVFGFYLEFKPKPKTTDHEEI